MPWEESQSVIRSGHKDSSRYEILGQTNLGNGISALFGKPKDNPEAGSEIVSYIFRKEDGWTVEKAQAWFKEHVNEAREKLTIGLLESGLIRVHEAFRWIQPALGLLKQLEQSGGKLVKIVSQHANIRNRNNRTYTGQELELAGRSLSFRPLNLNHQHPLPHDRAAQLDGLQVPINTALFSDYEDGRLETVAWVDDDIAQRIAAGELVKASPEGVYLDPSKNQPGHEVPSQLYFEALALLDRDTPPGDPLTQIVLERADGLQLFTVKDGSQEPSLTASPSATPRAGGTNSLSSSTSSAASRSLLAAREREWDTAYINDLPDSAFAYIEPGGDKDDGKTVPRSLRHLPYRNAGGEIDEPHLRNALARLPQTSLSAAAQAEARRKLVAAAKQVDIEVSEERHMSEADKGKQPPASPTTTTDDKTPPNPLLERLDALTKLLEEQAKAFNGKFDQYAQAWEAKLAELNKGQGTEAGAKPGPQPTAPIHTPATLGQGHALDEAAQWAKLFTEVAAILGAPRENTAEPIGYRYRVPILDLPPGWKAREEWIPRQQALMAKVHEALATSTAGFATAIDQGDILVLPPALSARLRDTVRYRTVPPGTDRTRFQTITTASYGALTENTEPTEVTQTLATVDATLSLRGVQQSVSYEAERRSINGQLIQAVTETFRLGELEDEDNLILTELDAATPAATLFGDESVSSDTGITSSMTFAAKRLASAIDQISRKGYQTDGLVAVLAPKQYGDLLKDLAPTGSITNWTQAALTGVIPDVYGIEVRRSGKVLTTTGTTAGVTVYKAEVYKPQVTCALAVERDLLVETFRDIRKNQTVLKASIAMGAKTLDGNSFVEIHTA